MRIAQSSICADDRQNNDYRSNTEISESSDNELESSEEGTIIRYRGGEITVIFQISLQPTTALTDT